MAANESDDKFTPKGQPLSAEELANYTDNGEVAITRGDVEKAIASSDDELRKFLEAKQKKK